MTICPVGADLFHVGGRTDKREANGLFRNFAKAPKNRMIYVELVLPLSLYTHTHTHRHVDIHHNKGTEGNILSDSVYVCMYVCEQGGGPWEKKRTISLNGLEYEG
jgi:hypothetical protein